MPSSYSQHLIGGMLKKIEEAAVIASLGIDVIIAKAGTHDGLQAMLKEPSELRSQQTEGCKSSMSWRGTIVKLSQEDRRPVF